MDNNSQGEPGDASGDQEPGSKSELEPEKTETSEPEVKEPETPSEPVMPVSDINIRLSESEEEIITELSKEAEDVTKDEVSKEHKPAEDVKKEDIRVVDNSKVTKDVAQLLAKAIVVSLDTMQATACKIVSQRSDLEWHFDSKDKDSLIDAWLPVTKKWGDKIPVEVIAILTTVSVIGTNVGVAVASRPKTKKEEVKEDKKK